MSGVVTVELEAEAPPDEVDQLRALVSEVDPGWRVEPRILRMSAADLPWVVMLSVPVTAFLTAFASDAGHAAWRGAHAWVARVYAARRGAGSVVLFDDEAGVSVVLRRDDPPEAYEALTGVLAAAGNHPPAHFWWDHDTGEWTAPR